MITCLQLFAPLEVQQRYDHKNNKLTDGVMFAFFFSKKWDDELPSRRIKVDNPPCPAGSEWHRAVNIFERMPEQSVPRDTISYNATISACDGQWESALRLFHAMLEDAVEPNVLSFSATISACEKAGRWQQALFFLFQAMPSASIQVNLVSGNAAISACEKASQWQQAIELLKSLSRIKVVMDAISFWSMV